MTYFMYWRLSLDMWAHVMMWGKNGLTQTT